MTSSQPLTDRERLLAAPEFRHAMERGARCTECPLFHRAVEEGKSRGPVLGQIRRNSKLAVIGEAPGSHEVRSGEPFVGPSGRILNAALARGGINRVTDSEIAERQRKGLAPARGVDDVSVTNVLMCQPPDSFDIYVEKLKAKGVTPLPTECCRPRLDRDIREANAPTEYAVGKQALAALARHYNIPYGKDKKKRKAGDISIAALRKQHGAPVPLRDARHPDGIKTLIASYHPAYAMRGAKAWMPIIKTVIERAASIAARGGEIDWKKPFYELNPSLNQIEAFVDEAVSTRRIVMVDIESGPSRHGGSDGAFAQTCVLRTIGMGFRRDDGEEIIMVVPWADMRGDRVWREEQYTRLRAALVRLFAEVRIGGQNFSFDSKVLMRYNLWTRRKKGWIDVMLGHHNTDSNDLPHDLGFIQAEYFEAPHHKHDVDHKSVDNVDYDDLKLYNADDVLGQLRCMYAVLARIDALDTTPQFVTDTKIAPIVRDMGDLGLTIDEYERRRLAVVLSERIAFFRAKFRYEATLLFQSQGEVLRAREKVKRIQHDWDADIKAGRRTPTEKAEFLTRAFQEYAQLRGFGEFNPNSVKQLRDLFFDKLDMTPTISTGGLDFRPDGTTDQEAQGSRYADEEDDPSTGQAAVLKLIDKYTYGEQMFTALLEYRAYDKLYGTYVADRKGRIREVDWTVYGLPVNMQKRILHTVYKVHVIPSGRLSTQPAIQNWPAVGKASMRTMVVAPDGHCLVGADYDQLELRIYAVVAQDKLLLHAFDPDNKVDGRPIDPHSLNAAALFAERDTEDAMWDKYREIISMPDKLKKYHRTVAKRFSFLEIYGGEQEKLFQTMASSRNKATGKKDFPNLTMRDVERWHNGWHRLHPETKRWQDRCKSEAHRKGSIRVESFDYRARHWPGGIDKINAPPNHTIQGFAASIANQALQDLEVAIPHRGWSPVSGLTLQVHDYIGGVVPWERAWEAKHLFEECMQTVYKGMTFTCTAEASYRWSDQG